MPLCLEKKELLRGGVHTYPCDLVRFEPGFGILKYVIDREYDIQGCRLMPGDVTWAFYWEDRPYSLYIWKLKDGAVLHYFNIADRISLAASEFRWRDLVVDILIDRHGAPQVLDRHELPPDLDKDLADYIDRSQERVLSGYRAIMDEADALLRELTRDNDL